MTSIYDITDVTVNLTLPFGFQVENWQASHVYVKSNDNKQIYCIALRSQPMAMKNAYDQALKLATQFRLNEEKIQS